MTDKAIHRSTEVVTSYAWVILCVVYLASLAAPLNQTKIPPILPIIMQAFQLNLLQAGSLMSILAVGGLILALPAGVLLQRFGSRAIGLIALGCMAAGSAIGAMAASYGALASSRAVEGIGIGLMGVVAPATIAMWFPIARQGMPMGIWATWMPVGSVLMSNLAPAIAISLAWRAVWWIGAGFTLLIMVFYGLLVHNPPNLPPTGFQHQTSPACFGCPFINVATEYPEVDHPGHQVALAHKQSVRARFNRLAEEAGASQPQALANALHLLMDGAYIAARVYGASPDNPAVEVAETARQVIDFHCAGV